MNDKTITPFAAWMKAATTTEQQLLADKLGTSIGMLYHYSSGQRRMSTERAASVEDATRDISKASKGRLPIVYRTDTSATCRACAYAQRCLGDKALASEFPIVAQG